jgi:hypothetical protein
MLTILVSCHQKSFLRSWRTGTRKTRLISTSDSAESTFPTEQAIVGATQVISVPASTVQTEPRGKDAEQNERSVQQSNIPRPVTPTLKDQYMLYPLHETSNTEIVSSSPGQFPIDIVAVHGLDGGAHKTWTHSNGYYWLQDSLPKDFPGARVYSFGYPAEILFTRGKSGITEFATALLEEVKAERKTQEVSSSFPLCSILTELYSSNEDP